MTNESMPGPKRPRRGRKVSFTTAALDVGLFIRRWKMLEEKGRATNLIRSIKKGNIHTELTVEHLEAIQLQAQAYQELMKALTNTKWTPTERFMHARGIVHKFEEGKYYEALGRTRS